MSLKRIILKIARNLAGLIVVFIDWLSRPKAIQRSADEQARVQAKFDGLSLYQLYACPFCVKTRRAIHALGVTVEPKDINKDPKNRVDLEQGGGRVKVPCLKIEQGNQVTWLYESNEIIRYLKQNAA